MKQQDIATLIIIIFIAGIASFFLSSKVVGSSEKKESSKVVSQITPEFTLPDNKIFNENAINPAVKIIVGQDPNSQPFVEAQE